MKTIIEKAFMICALACVATACQNEDMQEKEVMEAGLYIGLSTAGDDQPPLTRAYPDDETNVTSLYALYFQTTVASNPTDADYELKGIEPVTISHNFSGSTTTKLQKLEPYKLSTPVASVGNKKDMKLIFIANMNPSSYLTVGTTTLEDAKEDILYTAVSPNPTTSAWDANATTPLIPMYVCTGAVHVPAPSYEGFYYIDETNYETTNPQTFSLLRMMACFTITNNYTAGTGLADDQYNLEITKAVLKNGYNQGRVCHTDATNWIASKNVATGTSIPTTTPTNVATSSDILPVGTWNDNSTPQKLIFYTFESKSHSATWKDKDNCYIEITGWRRNKTGGKADAAVKSFMLPIPQLEWNATTGAATVKLDSNSKNIAGPIVRNHHYSYTITGVWDYSLKAKLDVKAWNNVNVGTIKPIPLR